MGEFLTRWLRDVARPRVRPRTYVTYEAAIAHHMTPHLGRVRLVKQTPQHLQTWLAALTANGVSTNNLARVDSQQCAARKPLALVRLSRVDRDALSDLLSVSWHLTLPKARNRGRSRRQNKDTTVASCNTTGRPNQRWRKIRVGSIPVATMDIQTDITQSPFAEIFPRLHELKEAVPDPTHPDAYFRHFAERIVESEHVRHLYMKVERPLRVLDPEAWRDLKDRAPLYLMVRDEKRGWQALFDTLNESKGYAYLRSIGCTDVAFIKRDSKKTPDLRGMLDGNRVVCEVKTINMSQAEADRRDRVHHGEIRAFKVPMHVTPQMLQKVSATLGRAVEQLDHEDPQQTARRIVFTILHFDDSVCDYQTEYIADIDAHLLANPVAGVELVFCPGSNLFPNRRFTMRSATVVEI